MIKNGNTNAYYALKLENGACISVVPVPEMEFSKSSSFTISIQFYITNLDKKMAILYQNTIFEIGIENKHPYFLCNSIGLFTSETELQENKWYTTSIVYQNAKTEIWINGKRTIINFSNEKQILDSNPFLSSNYILGLKIEAENDIPSISLRYVKLYDSALKENEIRAIQFENLKDSDTIPLLLDFTSKIKQDRGKHKREIIEENNVAQHCKQIIFSQALDVSDGRQLYIDSERIKNIPNNSFTITCKVYIKLDEWDSTLFSYGPNALVIQGKNTGRPGALGAKNSFEKLEFSSIPIQLDQWTDIAYCFNNDSKKIIIYVNGELYYTLDAPDIKQNNTFSFIIGNNNYFFSAFQGLISYFAIFKNILSHDKLHQYISKPPYVSDDNLELLVSASYPTIWCTSDENHNYNGDTEKIVISEDTQDFVWDTPNFPIINQFDGSTMQRWQANILATVYTITMQKLFGLEINDIHQENKLVAPNGFTASYIVKHIQNMQTAWRVISSYQNPVGIFNFLRKLILSKNLPILHHLLYGNGQEDNFFWISSVLPELLDNNILEKEINQLAQDAFTNNTVPELSALDIIDGCSLKVSSIIFNHMALTEQQETSAVELCDIPLKPQQIPEWTSEQNTSDNPSNTLYIRKKNGCKPLILTKIFICRNSERGDILQCKVSAESVDKKNIISLLEGTFQIESTGEYTVLLTSKQDISNIEYNFAHHEFNWSYEINGIKHFMETTHHDIYLLDHPCKPWKTQGIGEEKYFITLDDLKICKKIEEETNILKEKTFAEKIAMWLNQHPLLEPNEKMSNRFTKIDKDEKIHYNRQEARNLLSMIINSNAKIDNTFIGPLDISVITADYSRMYGNSEIGIIKFETKTKNSTTIPKKLGENQYIFEKNIVQKTVPLHLTNIRQLNKKSVIQDLYIPEHWSAATMKKPKDMIVYEGYFQPEFPTNYNLKFTQVPMNLDWNTTGENQGNGYRETYFATGSLCIPTLLIDDWKICSSLAEHQKNTSENPWVSDINGLFLPEKHIDFGPVKYVNDHAICHEIGFSAIYKVIQNALLDYFSSSRDDENKKQLQSDLTALINTLRECETEYGDPSEQPISKQIWSNLNNLCNGLQENNENKILTSYHAFLYHLNNIIYNIKHGNIDWLQHKNGNYDPYNWYYIDEKCNVLSSFNQILYTENTLYTNLVEFKFLPKVPENAPGFYLTNIGNGIKLAKWKNLRPEIREKLNIEQIFVATEEKTHYCLISSSNTYPYPSKQSIFLSYNPVYFISNDNWVKI